MIFQPEPCPYRFNSFKLGDEDENVRDIHIVLNSNQESYVAESGINAPGNESTYASESTIDAFKRFQAYHHLPVTGTMNQATRNVLYDDCRKLQKRIARNNNIRQNKHSKFFGGWKVENKDIVYQFFNDY